MSAPTPAERFAFVVVENVLGVVVEHWDTQAADRQGQVDAHLHYPDGRQAALEVTTFGDQAEMQFDYTLAGTDFTWPSAADSWWAITIGTPRTFRG